MTLMDVGDIAQMLADRVDSLVPTLLPGAIREGLEWRVGSLAGERGRSMAIHRGSGQRKGVWADFSGSGLRGDALELVSHAKFGGDKGAAIAWARSWLGIDNLDPARLQETRAKIQQKAKEDDRKAIIDADKRQRAAKALWLNASKVLTGSIVDLYLQGRGIGIADLPRPPGALRFASKLQYTDQKTGEVTYWPAMVAAICDGAGNFISAHRTFLAPRADKASKAPLDNAKLTYGSYKGGFISLARGSSGKPIADAPAGDRLIISEGIEDGLTMALSCPDHRVIAAVSVSNFMNIVLPENITDVIIAGQNKDAPGSKAALAIDAAIDRFIDQGRNVVKALPPPQFGDFNDVLMAAHGLKKAEAK